MASRAASRGAGSRRRRSGREAHERGEGGRRGDRLDGYHCVLAALRARRRELRRLLVAPTTGAAGRAQLAELTRAADAAGVPIEWVDARLLRAEDARGSAQHVALEAGPLPEIDLAAVSAGDAGRRRLILLDGVEDPQNLGAVARVADAAGATGLVLGRRHAAPLSAAASRASAGALEWLPVARVGNLAQAVRTLQAEGFWAVGTDPEAGDSVFDVEPRILRGDLIVVLGSEGKGLRKSIVDVVDHMVRIPLRGRVGSLNVSAAGAVVMFELMRRDLAERPSGGDAG